MNCCCIYNSINKHVLFCLQKANKVHMLACGVCFLLFLKERTRHSTGDPLGTQGLCNPEHYEAWGRPPVVLTLFWMLQWVLVCDCPMCSFSTALVCWDPVWLPPCSPTWSSAPPWVCCPRRTSVFLYFFCFCGTVFDSPSSKDKQTVTMASASALASFSGQHWS